MNSVEKVDRNFGPSPIMGSSYDQAVDSKQIKRSITSHNVLDLWDLLPWNALTAVGLPGFKRALNGFTGLPAINHHSQLNAWVQRKNASLKDQKATSKWVLLCVSPACGPPCGIWLATIGNRMLDLEGGGIDLIQHSYFYVLRIKGSETM